MSRAIKPEGADTWGLLPQIPTQHRKHLRLLAQEMHSEWISQGHSSSLKWDGQEQWALGGGCSREVYQVPGQPYVFKMCKDCAWDRDMGYRPNPKCQNKAEKYASRRLRRRGLPVIPHVLGVYTADTCVNIMHYYGGEDGGSWRRESQRDSDGTAEEYWRQRLEANNLIDVWYDNIKRLDNGRHVVVDLGCDDELYYKSLS